jgi:hypothetical protein
MFSCVNLTFDLTRKSDDVTSVLASVEGIDPTTERRAQTIIEQVEATLTRGVTLVVLAAFPCECHGTDELVVLQTWITRRNIAQELVVHRSGSRNKIALRTRILVANTAFEPDVFESVVNRSQERVALRLTLTVERLNCWHVRVTDMTCFVVNVAANDGRLAISHVTVEVNRGQDDVRAIGCGLVALEHHADVFLATEYR